LRTPLAILQTGLETQLRKSKQSADQEVIQSHLEEVERMTQLVNDLLQLSHLAEDGGKTALTAPVDISTLVQVTTDRFSQLADKHKVRLEVELPEDESVFIKGDKALLSHAIANVINNAVLYNKKNGRVSVRLFKKSAEAVIEIEDTGIGMSDEDVACAFDRFYRAEKSRARCSGGSGLGLSIVLAIVRAHNGRVKIQSTHDQGTIVRINLSLLETE
jgi:signal transduction histidine kinase